MIDISPAIQFKMVNKKKCLVDLINGNTYEIDNFHDLKFLLDMIDILPSSELNLINLMSDSYEESYIQQMLEGMKANSLLQSLQAINPAKKMVQEWVDHGWSDALILHLSSRNLKYFDDPIEVGGSNDLDFVPDFEIEDSEIDYLQRVNLTSGRSDISSNDILEAIQNRRSFQPFVKQDINLEELSTIFWFTNQYSRDLLETPKVDRNICFDSSFTALDSYLVIYKGNDSLQEGVYKYNKEKHALDKIKAGNFKKEISKLAIGQRRASSGTFSIIITGDWNKYSKRYNHERSYRNLLINTAQLAQFYLVLGTHYHYNSFMTPAILDEELYNFLSLKDSYPLYITTFG